jgi:hypothetical protein
VTSQRSACTNHYDNGRTNASRMSSEQAGAGSPFSRATLTFESACIRIRFGSHSLFSRSREWDSDRCWFAYDSVVNACSQTIRTALPFVPQALQTAYACTVCHIVHADGTNLLSNVLWTTLIHKLIYQAALGNTYLTATAVDWYAHHCAHYQQTATTPRGHFVPNCYCP